MDIDGDRLSHPSSAWRASWHGREQEGRVSGPRAPLIFGGFGGRRTGNSLTVLRNFPSGPILQLMYVVHNIQVAASGIRPVLVPNLDPRALGSL